MKKRILSMMLAPLLLFSIAAPGFAAEKSDSADRLAAVTEKVKDTLALDTERYKEFSGQLTEGELAPTWRLRWGGEDGSLEITASESGRVLSYYRFDDNDDSWSSAPLSLPKGDPAKAKDAAAAFLKRALASSETVDLDAAAGQENSLRQTRYYFRGSLLLNSCPSPLHFSLVVRASDNAVVQFYRDSLETGYIGTVPAANFKMWQGAVEPLLRGTLSLRLEYVLDEGEKTAVLRYLPNAIDSFYVDDADRKLVNLTKLYEELGRDDKTSGADAAMEAPSLAAGAESDNGLTQAEQLGADKLKGTLNKEALDQKARSVSGLGLDSYTLASVSYQETQAKDASLIIARLSYAKRAGERILYRWVTLDAKTGELMAVYSTRLWGEEEPDKVDEDAARKTAEAFLTAQQGGRFALCAPYTNGSAGLRGNGSHGIWGFQYVRQENGYFFPNDQFSVEIDAVDGSVSSYSQSWSEDVSFDSPDGIVSMEQAIGAYFKTFQVTRGYVAVPQKLDLSDPDYAPLVKVGYRALNSLKLGWQLTAPDKNAVGIDAKTGKPVYWGSEESSSLKYSDLTGSQAGKAAETLADYGIGYAGGKFRLNKKLTQLDLVALLASTQGVLINPDNLADGDADRAYRTAYSMGALQRADRNDSQILSRIDVIKILLNAGGYGVAAQFQGIYRTDFSDEVEIPEGLLGYAALAQAMSVAQGDSAGRLNPNRSATRGDAGVMLLAFMQRD